MRPSIELIAALRRAADRIEDPNGGYIHCSFSQCNCGFLARELLGVGRDDVRFATMSQEVGSWADAAMFCDNTGLPILAIVRELQAVGLPTSELEHIEELSDEAVIARAAKSWPEKYICWLPDDPRCVVAYFRAWATLLEEQLQQEQAEENLRQVGVESRHAELADDFRSPSEQALRNSSSQERVLSLLPDSPSSDGHLPQSLSPITSALAKSAPCSHLFISPGDSCVLCGFIKPATSPVQVGGGE